MKLKSLAGFVFLISAFLLFGGESSAQERGFDPGSFIATFYDRADLNDSLLSEPYLTPIDFCRACFGQPSPFPGCKLIDELVDGGDWSVQWQGMLVVPDNGNYTFTLNNVDDGVRLFLDGEEIVDKGWYFPDDGRNPSPQMVSVNAGGHGIRIDYEQRVPGAASLQVRWAGPGFADEVIPIAEDPGDLSIGWIGRLPEMDYVWGSPDPAAEGWPAVGQQVTWRAYVKNWSKFARADALYQWYLDGAEVAAGVVDIPAHSTITINYPWLWTFDRHALELVIDGDNQIVETEEENNRLLIYTDAISLGLYVEQSVYYYFHAHQNKLGIGSNGWEDWAQRQVSRWNEMFANADYPETPGGVVDRIRLDKITIVPDCALPLVPGGFPTNSPNLNDRTVDLQWGFPVTLLEGALYKDHSTVNDQNAFYFEGSLIHELGHARYLIDTYGFNVHDDGSGNTVAITENGSLIVGTAYMPFISLDGLYFTPENGLMSSNYTTVDRYSAMALNLIAGHRATYGNYNAPGNLGVFLNRDLPDQNRLTVKDVSGNILANADLIIYRSTGQAGVWYGKYYDDGPDMEFTTDVNGQVFLGPVPFDEDGTIDHGYGNANGTLIIRIAHGGRVGYAFLEATQFNIEYWRGHTSIGDYEIRVDLIEPTTISPEEIVSDVPVTYHLSQNFPNPFNPTTRIRFDIPEPGYVTLKVYNVLGEEVAILFSDYLSAGKYRVEWNGSGMSNGLYLYQLKAGEFVVTKKMILLK